MELLILFALFGACWWLALISDSKRRKEIKKIKED